MILSWDSLEFVFTNVINCHFESGIVIESQVKLMFQGLTMCSDHFVHAN